jgi:aerobic-type carbon monoxide dehydrogenase small subunit (CoxS/CutS family)
MAIQLKVNGKTRAVPAEPNTPLLYVLRNDFELNGAKFGCRLSMNWHAPQTPIPLRSASRN